MRLFKTFAAGALGLSLAAAPVLAQEAAPLSVAAAQGEESSGYDTMDYAIPALAIIAVLTAAILLSNDSDDDDLGNPVSP